MARGDTYQQISPFDRWIFDAAGNFVGAQTPHAVGGELRTSAYLGVLAGDNGAAASAANTASIQAALNGRGTVQVPPAMGDIFVRQAGNSGTALVWYPNTRFVVGAGSVIRLAPGSNCNIGRNASWGSAANAVTQLSTPDAGITINVQSAVLPAVGSYVIVLGAAQRVYNLAYRVLTSGGGAFTAALSTRLAPAETPTTPATGTVVWLQADENITIEGEFNYDSANQTTPDTWLKHALYLRRVVNASLDVTVKDATKYAIALGNAYQSSVRRAYFDTVSDGIHLIGSWDDVHIGTVQGKTGDDMVAAGNSDYAQYLDGAHITGDGGTLKVETIIADGSLTAFKYFGCSTNTCKSIQINTVQGRISGGAGFVNLINDPGVTGGSSSSLERCEVGIVVPAEPISTAVVQTAGAITVTNLRANVRARVNNNANARPIFIGSGSTVTNASGRLDIDAAAYAGNSFGLYVAGTVTDGNFDGTFTNVGINCFVSGSAGASRIVLGKWIGNNCGQLYRNVSATSQVLHFDHAERNGYQSSPAIDMSNTAAGSTFSCSTAVGLTGTDAYGGTGNNKTVLFAPQIGIDVGGTGVVRQAGAMVLHRGARGSLVDNNLAVCDATGAAGSWTHPGGGAAGVLTFTGALAAATSSTLTASFGGATGAYTVTFSDGSIRSVTLTNGATTATWTGAVTATANAVYRSGY